MDSASKLNELVNDTEELLAELGDKHGAEIDDLRTRLLSSIDKTRSAIDKQQRNGSQVKVRDVALSLNEYVQEYPWLALATGVLLASTVGILATAATRRSYSR
jgi:ElaB/YqjD/DUF883 family membrane-anchored ribosome-binding protein